MFGEINKMVIKLFSFTLKKFFSISYSQILLDKHLLEIIKNPMKKISGPIIFIPTHKSYLDFLIVSYVMNFFKSKVPFIAAADDMAGITGVF
jgi:glycerol-3-phosphate O-acyltransferase